LSQLTWIGVDDKYSLVEHLDCLLEATECLSESDLHQHDEVHPPSLEHWMFLLIQDYDDVSWFYPWLLVALSSEPDLLAVTHT